MAYGMSDKLSALRQQQQNRISEYIPPETSGVNGDLREEISGTLDSVNDLSQATGRISNLIEDIRHNHEVILASFQNQAAKDDNERKTKELKTLSKKIHVKLKETKRQMESETGQARDSANFRIKKAQYTALIRRFRDVMEEYNQVQDEYRDRSKERIQRQLKYAGKEVSEDQMDEMLESDNTQIFTQDMMVQTAQRRQALGEVEARHMEILRLEADIRELHDMFYDMALLVEEQGELVDVIERNVETAAVYIYKGRGEMQQAAVYKSGARRKKCCICCIVMGLLLGLLIGVAIVIALAVYFSLNN
jgi:t-SNARE complex subunit (syntaxin)